jgi:hypothetical protein
VVRREAIRVSCEEMINQRSQIVGHVPKARFSEIGVLGKTRGPYPASRGQGHGHERRNRIHATQPDRWPRAESEISWNCSIRGYVHRVPLHGSGHGM